MKQIPLLRYPGGKHSMYTKIAPLIPPHRIYTEAFGGSAAMLLNKARSPMEVYNDLSDDAWNFMTMFRDNPTELIRLITYTPWSTKEHKLCMEWHPDPMERARRFYFRCWSSIRPFDKSPGFRRQKKLDGGMTAASKAFMRTDHLQEYADRLRGVVLENKDAAKFLRIYDGKDTVHFVDPPFLGSARKNKHQILYGVEMKSDAEHTQLAESLNQLAGMVILCGYRSELYEHLYEANGWERHDLTVRINGGRQTVESIWLNAVAKEALALHLVQQTNPAEQRSIFDLAK